MSKKKLETKDFKFTIEEMDEEKGTFTGYASVFGVVDSYGDMVKPGAFKKTLKEQGQFPVLWSHNIMEPLGVVGGHEDAKGLSIQGQLNLDVQRAREVRSLMKQGAVNGLSIGYQTLDEGKDKDSGARLLKEVKLWEISPVVFQACPDAVVEEVKSAAMLDFEMEMERRIANAKDLDDLSMSLKDLLNSPCTVGPDGHLKIIGDTADNDHTGIDLELTKEPEKSTPAVEDSKPEHLHLLEQFRDNVAEFKKVMEEK